MRMPGTKVRNRKPASCLRTGMSSPISPSIASNSPRQRAKHLLISQSLGGFNDYSLPEAPWHRGGSRPWGV